MIKVLFLSGGGMFMVAENGSIQLDAPSPIKYLVRIQQKRCNHPNLFVSMTFSDLLLSMFGGIIAGLGISSIVYGSRMLPASIYGMTSYFQLIYGIILGWLVFQQLPTTFNYIGIVIVFSAGILLFYFVEVYYC